VIQDNRITRVRSISIETERLRGKNNVFDSGTLLLKKNITHKYYTIESNSDIFFSESTKPSNSISLPNQTLPKKICDMCR
jgi:hypothetical protein